MSFRKGQICNPGEAYETSHDEEIQNKTESPFYVVLKTSKVAEKIKSGTVIQIHPVSEEEPTCECLKCPERFGCDFVLSAWAAKARMRDFGIKVSFITIECEGIE